MFWGGNCGFNITVRYTVSDCIPIPTFCFNVTTLQHQRKTDVSMIAQ